MKALGPVLMLLIVYSIVITWVAISLYYRIKASKDPLQVLPKKDRVAFARELLDRQQDEYEDERQARLEKQIKGYLSPDLSTHRKENAVEDSQ